MPVFCPLRFVAFLHGAILCAYLFVGIASAGPLSPPSGAVQPTGVPLSAIEPRTILDPGQAVAGTLTIAAPGAYALIGHFSTSGAASAIVINADDVDLDLRGFAITAQAKTSSIHGINVIPGRDNTTIRNGTVRGFGGSGINSLSATRTRLVDVRVFQNGSDGATLGADSAISGSMARGNTGNGFRFAGAGSIVHSVASENSQSGFLFTTSGAASDCVARGNSAYGFNTLGNGSFTFSNCTAQANLLCGYRITSGASLTSCAATANAVHGFEILGTANLSACTAISNSSDGFNVISAHLTGCTAALNLNDGFELRGKSSVRLSLAHTNSSANIHINGAGNAVDNNSINSGPIGIRVNGSGAVFGNTILSVTNTAIQVDASGDALIGPLTSDPAVAGPRDNLVQ